MTDTLDRLKAALADRYAIEHELGAGGCTCTGDPRGVELVRGVEGEGGEGVTKEY